MGMKWEMSKVIILAAGQKVQAGPGAGHEGELEAHLLEDNFNRRHQELPSVLGKAGGDWTQGEQSVFCMRGQGEGRGLYIQVEFYSRNKTQELKEKDWNLVAAANILNLLFGKLPSVYGF